jgi:hypothetical protein
VGGRTPFVQLSEVALLGHSSCLITKAGVGMRRRDFVTVLAGAAAYPLSALGLKVPPSILARATEVIE